MDAKLPANWQKQRQKRAHKSLVSHTSTHTDSLDTLGPPWCGCSLCCRCCPWAALVRRNKAWRRWGRTRLVSDGRRWKWALHHGMRKTQNKQGLVKQTNNSCPAGLQQPLNVESSKKKTHWLGGGVSGGLFRHASEEAVKRDEGYCYCYLLFFSPWPTTDGVYYC